LPSKPLTITNFTIQQLTTLTLTSFNIEQIGCTYLVQLTILRVNTSVHPSNMSSAITPQALHKLFNGINSAQMGFIAQAAAQLIATSTSVAEPTSLAIPKASTIAMKKKGAVPANAKATRPLNSYMAFRGKWRCVGPLNIYHTDNPSVLLQDVPWSPAEGNFRILDVPLAPR